jgi:ribosomal protein S25
MKFYQSDIDRFWNKVNVFLKEDGSPDLDKCMIWIAYKDKDGYGTFSYAPSMYKAHRISFEMYYGFIDLNMDILHSCDNPSCVNPLHLQQGTHQENIKQRDMKGRTNHPIGDQNGKSILTNNKVKQILIDIDNNKYNNVFEIADKYGVHVTAIRKILNSITWTHITNQLTTPLQTIKDKVSGSNHKLKI